MTADKLFDATVAIARDVVEERRTGEGQRLHLVLAKANVVGWFHSWLGFADNERNGINRAASEFAAPYLARIAELEKETLFDILERLGDHCHIMNPNGYADLDADGVRARIFKFVEYLTEHAMGDLRENVAKLEAENKALRDAARAVLDARDVDVMVWNDDVDDDGKLQADAEAELTRTCDVLRELVRA